MRDPRPRMSDDPLTDADWNALGKQRLPTHLRVVVDQLRGNGNRPVIPTQSTRTSSPPYEEFRNICRRNSLPYALRAVGRKELASKRRYRVVKLKPA
jgi:hypothetical protein